MSAGPAVSLNPAPGRILVRGVNWLGDAVMTTPALRRLRERFPGAHISLFGPEKIAELWLGHPGVDATITFTPGESPRAIAPRLREGKFDLALILPNSPRSALETWLAGVPQRVGYAGSWRRLLLTRAVRARPESVRMRQRSVGEIRRLVRKGGAREKTPDLAHQIHEYLHLVGVLGCDATPVPPRLAVSREERDGALTAFAAEFQAAGIPLAGARTPGLAGLNPGAEYGPAKRWPGPNFAAVAREVSRKVPSLVWVVFGGEREVKLGNEILRLSGVQGVNLAGKTSLRQLMGLLSQCRLLLTNDTGPMHVAAALGTRVIVPFGSTSPSLTSPDPLARGGHRILSSNAPCSPCFRRVCPIDQRCLTRIGVDSAVRATLEVLAM
jgi:heptosyltransferase-2